MLKQPKLLSLILLIYLGLSQALSSPKLILPVVLENLQNIDPSRYLISEKLDGMRAYWDGKQLFAKSGKPIHAPKWFLENFPPFELDGELWSNRNEFEKIISIIKNHNRQEAWKDLKFNIFEVPNQKGNLSARLQVIKNYLSIHHAPYIRIIPQYQFTKLEEITHFFHQIKHDGGEGIILRKNDTPYLTGRDRSALKFKVFFDSECMIKGYEKGAGKYAKVMGSIICEDIISKQIVKIGSGFSDLMRANPPKVGTIITYKYYQKTKNNHPKHPVFLRIRDDF